MRTNCSSRSRPVCSLLIYLPQIQKSAPLTPSARTLPICLRELAERTGYFGNQTRPTDTQAGTIQPMSSKPPVLAHEDLMLAKPTIRAFTREGWLFELKYDGFRALSSNAGGEARIVSRNGINLAKIFP